MPPLRPARCRHVVLIGALLAAGCSGGGADLEGTCARVARIRCAKIATCTRGWEIARDYGDEAGCRAEQARVCLEGLQRPRTGSTPASEEACAQVIAQQSCDQWLNGPTPPECQPAEGPLAEGAPCLSSSQCSSRYCDVPPNLLCGRCGRRLPQGSPCDSSSDCLSGHSCVRVDGAAICVRRAGPGEACNATRPCATGQVCVGASTSAMTDGTCQPLGAREGEPCDPRMRSAPTCDGRLGLHCNPVTLVCAKRTLVREGEICGTFDNGTSVTCLSGGTCKREADPRTGVRADTGTCVPPAAEGQPCDGSEGPGCVSPLRCVSDAPGTTAGTCRRRDYAVCLASP